MFFNRITRFVGVAVSWMMVSALGAPAYGAKVMHTSGKRKSGAVRTILIGACLAFMPVQSLRAATYDFTKTIMWGQNAAIPGQGKYLVHVMGDDKHGHDHQDTPGGGGFAANLDVRLRQSGNVENDVPINAQHEWTLFPIPAAPLPFIFGPINKQTAGGLVHASADGNLRITVSRPPETNSALIGTIRGWGSASIIGPPLHPPETAYAQSASAGALKFKDFVSISAWNNPPRPARRGSVTTLAKGGFVGGSGEADARNERSRSFAGDPISLTFFDTADESVLGSSILYQDAFTASGDARIDWDLAGDLVLTAAAGSDNAASVQISTPSEWVLNPLNATALVSNGEFTVSGMFVGLPWDIVMDAGRLTARLPMSAIPHTFSILYDASSLPDSMGDVRAELDSDGDGEAFDYATIPAPGTLAILGLACAIAIRRRRID